MSNSSAYLSFHNRTPTSFSICLPWKHYTIRSVSSHTRTTCILFHLKHTTLSLLLWKVSYLQALLPPFKYTFSWSHFHPILQTHPVRNNSYSLPLSRTCKKNLNITYGKMVRTSIPTPPNPKGFESRNCNLIRIFTFQVPKTWWVVNVCWMTWEKGTPHGKWPLHWESHNFKMSKI